KNPKPGRPFVVIQLPEASDPDGKIVAVGITSGLDQSPKGHYVYLPYGDQAKTKLKEKSAALCTWLIEISAKEVKIGQGFVDDKYALEIIKRANELAESKPEEPAPPTPPSES